MYLSLGYYRAEEILPEEMDIGPNACLVTVAHFHKDARSTFGFPVLLKVIYTIVFISVNYLF